MPKKPIYTEENKKRITFQTLGCRVTPETAAWLGEVHWDLHLSISAAAAKAIDFAHENEDSYICFCQERENT